MVMLDDTFVTFANHLARVRDDDSLTSRLCEVSRAVLDAGGSVVTVRRSDHGHRTVCATDALAELLESLQDTVGEGPVLDALETDDVVTGEFDGGSDTRWDRLRAVVAETAFSGTLITIPLTAEVPLVGSLTVHRHDVARASDAAAGRFLGAAVGTALLQDSEFGVRDFVFSEVTDAQPEVRHASDLVVERLGVRREDALVLLRALAFFRGADLREASEAVIDGRWPLAAAS